MCLLDAEENRQSSGVTGRLQMKGSSYPESAVLGGREVSVEGTCGGYVTPGAASEHVCPQAAPMVTLGQDSTQARTLCPGVPAGRPPECGRRLWPFAAGAVTVTQGDAELRLHSGHVSRRDVNPLRRLSCVYRPRLPAGPVHTGAGGRGRVSSASRVQKVDVQTRLSLRVGEHRPLRRSPSSQRF